MRATRLQTGLLLWLATASPVFAQMDLSPFQWNLDLTDTSRGVCTTVPDASGNCTRATELPVANSDVHARLADLGTISHKPVLIGLIDTGIDYLHPDITQHVWNNSGEMTGLDASNDGIDDGCQDGIDNDGDGYADDCHGINLLVPQHLSDGRLNPAAGDPMDSSLGHGTYMAGAMVGYNPDGTGIRGIAGRNPDIRVVTCKAAQMEQALALIPNTVTPAVREDNAETCVRYFLSLKQRGENLAVINLSGGMSKFINLTITNALVKPEYLLDTPGMRNLLGQLAAQNIVVVAAAGNLAWDMDANPAERAYFPAAFDANNVISVAASDAQGRLWSGSSWGRYSVDVAAPGHLILGAAPRAAITGDANNALYTLASGTSPATATVSGIVALSRANPATASLSAAETRRLVLASGRPLPALANTTLAGRLVRLDDSNGQSALNCQGQTVQRRIAPRSNAVTLLAGDTLHVEVESFTCSQATIGTLTMVMTNGTSLTLRDDGTGADRTAGDAIFSGDWVVPANPADSYGFTLSQGPQMPTETLTVNTTLTVDNTDAGTSVSGWWWLTTLRPGYVGGNYVIAYLSSAEQLFRWPVTTPRAGRYEVQVRSPATSAFASNALYRFTDGNGVIQQVRVNQQLNGGQWTSLGTYRFTAGNQQIQLSNLGANGTVAADAIRLRWVP